MPTTMSIRNEPGDESGIDHSEGYLGVVSALRRNETIEELSVNVCGDANETAVETMFESLESMLKDSNHTLLSLCVCERNLPPNIERLLSINPRGRPYAQIGKGLVLKEDLAGLSRSVFPEVVTRICQVGGGLSAVYSATKHMSESLLHSGSCRWWPCRRRRWQWPWTHRSSDYGPTWGCAWSSCLQ